MVGHIRHPPSYIMRLNVTSVPDLLQILSLQRRFVKEVVQDKKNINDFFQKQRPTRPWAVAGTAAQPHSLQ